jgi:hypothetical protein
MITQTELIGALVCEHILSTPCNNVNFAHSDRANHEGPSAHASAHENIPTGRMQGD